MNSKLLLLNIFLLTISFTNAQKKEVVIPFNHSYNVEAIDISADGQYIVSAGVDNTVKLWDAVAGKLLHTFGGHIALISAVAISKDNRYIVSGSWDKTIKLWDIANKQLLHTFEGHTESVNTLSISDDNRYIASSNNLSNRNINIWNLEERKLEYVFINNYYSIDEIRFLKDSRYFVTNKINGDLHFWDIAEKKDVFLLEWYYKNLENKTILDIFNDFRYTATTTYDNDIKLWNTFGEGVADIFKVDNRDDISFIKVSKNERYIIAAVDKNIMVWDVASKELLHNIEAHSSKIKGLAISDKDVVVSFNSVFLGNTSENTIKIWDLDSLRLRHTFEGRNTTVSALVISDNNRYMAHSAGNMVKLYDFASKRLLHTFEGHTALVNRVAVSKNGRYVVSGSWDKTIKIWDIARKRLLHTFQEDGIVFKVSISPDNRYIFSGQENNQISIWDIKEKKRSSILTTEYDNGIHAITISKDNHYMLSAGGYKESIMLWDWKKGVLLHTFELELGWITSLEISDDNESMLVATNEGVAALVDIPSKKIVHIFETQNLASDFSGNQYATISGDGSYIVTVFASSNKIKLWNTKTKELLHTFEGHKGEINSVQITADNKYIVSGSFDNTIKIWDITKRKLVLTLYNFEAENAWVATTPDGKYDGSHAGLEAIYYVENLEIIPLNLQNDPSYTPNLVKEILQIQLD